MIVVGGGCYGHYYLRQLGRAARAGALGVEEVVVVDRDPACRVMRDPPPEAAALPWCLSVGEWRPWFARTFAEHADTAASDAIVPSPLMPHLFFEWLLDRATARWPTRSVALAPVPTPPDEIPWQRAAPDGRHYVSYATWMCPVNCIEPAKCPHTRDVRDWSLPVTIERWRDARAQEGDAFAGVITFHCTHRTHGVGMVDVAALQSADRLIAGAGERSAGVFLVGTLSHCHGALAALSVGEPQRAAR